MPMIYEGRCSACEATTGLTGDGYYAVFVDQPPEDFRHSENPNLAILAHPGESQILEELGITLESAAWNGRIVRIDRVFCQNCGQPFEIRTLTAGLVQAFGCIGCLTILILAGIVGVLVGYQYGALGYFVGWGVLLLLIWAVNFSLHRFVRWRHPSRVKAVDTPRRCPHCHSSRYRSPGELRGKIPCSSCGERAVTFRCAGHS